MTVLRSILLFALAALAEIGGAWLVWQGVREHRGLAFVGAGVLSLGLYGFVATLQPDPRFGRILAAYGGSLWPVRWPGAWPSTASGPTATTWRAPPCAWPGWPSSCTPPGPARTSRPPRTTRRDDRDRGQQDPRASAGC
jgi:small multidrug resistance family-3 protein